jgi:hypothetical protein
MLHSHICIMDVEGNSEHVVYSAPEHFEAPNWSPDGSYLLLNCRGKLWRLPTSGDESELVPTGTVTYLNNDHGISPDGSLLAISAGPIYTIPPQVVSHGASQKRYPVTSTAGPLMVQRQPTAHRVMVSSTFTLSLWEADRKSASPLEQVLMMALTIPRMGNGSTSTPIVQEAGVFGEFPLLERIQLRA